ncbi:LytR/AlgR family response regulator transcription factor [Sphingobacterium sp. UBA5670]|uniref:LytR/AlgR family response regulator transcription factor n=1 Tax=Sphingobacterium sp. UBA5670 TaxID=1947502 RepID=UPI0025EEBCEB|nr:LytTR family DNA-binding domain-containing protein [Sphingobacterium sp. UBA5670]
MILNCMVIDDDAYIIRLLRKYIEQSKSLQFCGGFTDPGELMEDLSGNSLTADIIFLDVALKGSSGLDILPKLSQNAIVILISGDPSHGPAAFELGAQGYLTKPISYDKFISAVEKGRKIYREQKAMLLTPPLPYYYIPGEGREVKTRIKTDELIYIEAVRNFSLFHISKSKFHISKLTLKEIESLLPAPHFMRISRSNIVNMAKVEQYDAHDVILENDIVLSFGSTYRDKFIWQIKNTGMLY